MTTADRLRTIAALACLLALASGCSAPKSGSNTTGHASVSPSPAARTSPIPIDQAPADLAAKWRDLDVTVVPPAGFGLEVQLTQPVINHTGGRVDDTTARRWAADYLRADAWSAWGTQNLQLDGFFRHLAPPDAISQAGIFADQFGAMQKASRTSGSVRAKYLTVDHFTLVGVTAEVKAALTKTYGYPAPIPDYAFVLDDRGPSSLVISYPDGHTEAIVSHPDTYRPRAFEVGEQSPNPGTLGEIWLLHTDLSCERNDFLRANCGV